MLMGYKLNVKQKRAKLFVYLERIKVYKFDQVLYTLFAMACVN